MPEHTPGPWTLSHGLVRPDSPRCRIVSGEKGASLTFVNIWHDAPEEAEANARLIAAAPELLEAVQTTLVFLMSKARRDPAERGVVDHLRDVLAKAEGHE